GLAAFARAAPESRTLVVIDLADGRPVANLRVRVRAGDEVMHSTTTSNGELSLPAHREVELAALDKEWSVLPSRVPAGDDIRRLAAHRFITVAGRLKARGVDDLDEADVFATFVDPSGKDRQVCSGASWVHPWGMRTLWRVGIPKPDGRFEVRLPKVRGLALFARMEDRFAPVRRIALKNQRDLEIRMVEGLVVAGKVLDPAGQPVAGALVRMEIVLFGKEHHLPPQEFAIRLQQEEPGRSRGGREGDLRVRAALAETVRTETDGSFQFVSPTDGACALSVRTPDHAALDREAFWLDSSVQTLRISLSPPRTDARVPVAIDGKAKPGAKVMVCEFVPAHRPANEDHANRMWMYPMTLDARSTIPAGCIAPGRRLSLITPDFRWSTKLFTWPPEEGVTLQLRDER
ncbi:MAG: hypothetical protein AAGD14_13820, partial [Planctomycetota bacterium]